MSLTLDDRVALELLVYRYNVAADERDADAYAAAFTRDGVWDCPLGRFAGEVVAWRVADDEAVERAAAGERRDARALELHIGAGLGVFAFGHELIGLHAGKADNVA